MVNDKSEAKLVLSGLDQHTDSIALHLRRFNDAGKEILTTRIVLSATDEANRLPFTLGERSVVSGVEASQYINLHLAGKSTELILRPVLNQNERLVLELVELNPHFPFSFSIVRVLLCALTLWLLYILLPSHGYYQFGCAFSRPLQRVVILFVVLIQICFFTFCNFSNPIFENPPWYYFWQYQRLAVALSHFDLHLADIPSTELQEAENPYDTAYLDANGIEYLFDTAYYDGNYFCYFSIVAVLMFHLPYYLLTGRDFPTNIGVYLSAIVLVLLAFWLVALLIKRFAGGRVPLLVYLICSVLLCSCVTYLISYPGVYTLAVLLTIMYSMLGLCLWLHATRDGRLHTGWACMGSLAMALVSGCRPQLLLCSFLAIPIFWDYIVKQRLLFSKKTFWRTTAVLMPYIIVGAGMMAYNYFRFGSPFDFGAAYNLTTNDMTKRGFVLSRIPVALFLYFFQTPSLQAVFPFFGRTSQSSHYLGRTISEYMYGGVFFTNILTLASLYVFRAKRLFKKQKELWWMAVLCFCFSFALAVFDAQFSGILERYMPEFSWLLIMTAVLVIAALFSSDSLAEQSKKVLYTFTSLSFVVGMAYFLMVPFITRSISDLMYVDPGLYYSVYYGMQFWL